MEDVPAEYDSDRSSSINAQYLEGYGDLDVHRVMLTDGPRMAFYHGLLSDQREMQGRVVVDVGAGSGILSVWASRLGKARHVYLY